jgi:predicted transcriptional regulator
VGDAVPGIVAVTLSIAPALEERVIDWLLARGDVAAFTSAVVYAYGADSRSLSVAEQVSGRQRRVELAIELPAIAVESWLEELATAFVGREVGYRVTPVLLSGHLAPGAA